VASEWEETWKTQYFVICFGYDEGAPIWYARCRAILSGIPDAGGLVRRMPLLEQTRFRCYELKNKYHFRTKTGELHQVIF